MQGDSIDNYWLTQGNIKYYYRFRQGDSHENDWFLQGASWDTYWLTQGDKYDY